MTSITMCGQDAYPIVSSVFLARENMVQKRKESVQIEKVCMFANDERDKPIAYSETAAALLFSAFGVWPL